MKFFITTIALLVSSLAFANKDGYELKLDVSVNGKLVSSPRIRTVAGETASIVQKNEAGETFIDVVATEGQGEIKGKKAILMKFVVGTIENGIRKVLAQPQVMASENSKAEISVGQNHAQEKVNLSIVAERISL